MNDWSDAERCVERAREFFEQRKWSEALGQLRAALAINPFNASCLFNIGLTLDQMHHYDEALQAYRQALEIEPDDVETLDRLGIGLTRTGRYPQALEAFGRMEKLDASHEVSYCRRIVTYTQMGQHEQAEEMFYLARMYKENCPHCYYNIGISLAARRLVDKAIFCWQRTLDLDGDYPQAHMRLAETYWTKGNLELARRHYLVELRKSPGDMQALLALGNLLQEMGHAEEADEKFRHAIELFPQHPAGHFCHSRWLLDRGQLEGAIHGFSKTLQLDPTYPGAHLAMARICLARRQPERARRHLRNEHLLLPENPRILLELANLLMDNGDVSVALVCLRRLVRMDGSNAAAWQNLAIACFMDQRWDEGTKVTRQGLERHPRHRWLLYNMAVACEHQRDYDQATYWLALALAIDAYNATFHRLAFRLRLMRAKARLFGAIRVLRR